MKTIYRKLRRVLLRIIGRSEWFATQSMCVESTVPKPHFRLRFRLPWHQSLDFEGETLQIPAGISQAKLRLKRGYNSKIAQVSRWYTLTGGPYISMDEARREAAKSRHALIRYSIQSRIGIDLGNDTATGGGSSYLKNHVAKTTGSQLLNDVHGLQLYEGSARTRFISVGEINAIAGQSSKVFLEQFQQAYQFEFQPTTKQEVAFDLYGSAKFERSNSSRFLLLVMAVEALLEPPDREPSVQEHVQLLIEQTRQSELSQIEKESLLGSLQWLLKESIGRTGKNLAKENLARRSYGGKSPGAFFRQCYNLRSQLVHSGTINGSVDLRNIVSELDKFVADLLGSVIPASPSSAAIAPQS